MDQEDSFAESQACSPPYFGCPHGMYCNLNFGDPKTGYCQRIPDGGLAPDAAAASEADAASSAADAP